jgi:hypothetical protein
MGSDDFVCRSLCGFSKGAGLAELAKQLGLSPADSFLFP